MSRVHLIINPRSAGGRTARRIPDILDAFRRRIEDHFALTTVAHAGDARRAARSAAEDGAGTVIVVGGDGTMQEAVNGLLQDDKPLNPECALGMISSGTGQGFAMSLDLPQDLERQVDIALFGEIRALDAGKVMWRNERGIWTHRYFINECQCGFGAAVCEALECRGKWLGGKLGYGYAALRRLIDYRASSLRVEVNGDFKLQDSFIGIIAANGSRTGGGMRIAPIAKIDDEELDLVLFNDRNFPARLRTFAGIYSGSFLRHSEVKYLRARTIELSSSGKTMFEADGEVLGCLPCRIEVLPRALRFRSPAKGRIS